MNVKTRFLLSGYITKDQIIKHKNLQTHQTYKIHLIIIIHYTPADKS